MAFKDKLKKVNPKVPPIAVMAAAIVLMGVFALQVVMPAGQKKSELTEELTGLQAKVEESKLMARKKDQFKAEQQKLVDELKAAQLRFPTSEEQAKLLEDINSLIKGSGLKLNNWTKGEPRTDPLGLYTEITITYDVDGSFHDLGKFMERLDGMTRLLTVTNLDMSSAVLKGYKMDIPTKFAIVAYSAAPAAGGK